MTPKTPLQLHREFYERRREEIEVRLQPRNRTEPREPSTTDGREQRLAPTKHNGHQR